MESINVVQQVLVAGLSKFVLTPFQPIEARVNLVLQAEDICRLL